MLDKKQTGIVFNIQKFCVHDGTGIRTNIFLKGCPLSCLWCCNPESQNREPERAFNPSRCLGAGNCAHCVQVCPSGALTIREGCICYDKTLCNQCGKCTDICPTGAQSFYGKSMTVQEVLKTVQDDDAFYSRSGGGLTLSGGEAMARPDFALAILREAKRMHINTAMETCGCCKTEDLREAAALLDTLIMDIKSPSSEKHKIFTNSGNELILQNMHMLLKEFPALPIIFRTPVIPGFNDTKEDIMAIRAMIPRRAGVSYELLTYHCMGQPKYAYLGRKYALDGVKADEKLMECLRACAG